MKIIIERTGENLWTVANEDGSGLDPMTSTRTQTIAEKIGDLSVEMRGEDYCTMQAAKTLLLTLAAIQQRLEELTL